MSDPQADARVAVALAALAEVTDPADVGELVDATEIEPGLVDLHFATTLPGYPGWRWTVSTGLVERAAPTVLEIELLPGEGALLAPPWVPWTERLAEWRRSHPADADGDIEDDDTDDDDDETGDDSADSDEDDDLEEDPDEDDDDDDEDDLLDHDHLDDDVLGDPLDDTLDEAFDGTFEGALDDPEAGSGHATGHDASEYREA